MNAYKPGFAVRYGDHGSFHERGFWITFDNGHTVSVQFGTGNYCENRDGNAKESKDAEIAAWDADGDWIHVKGFDYFGDDVLARQSPEAVVRFISAVSQL